MEQLGIELSLEDNFSQAFSSISSSVISTFDTMGSKSNDAVGMWQSVITSVTDSIPVVGNVVSGFIDSLFNLSDNRGKAQMDAYKSKANQMAQENSLMESELKYSLASDERATSEALHQLKISNLMQEIEMRKKAGEDVSKYEIQLIEQEANYREAKLKESFDQSKEYMNFEMEQFKFLSSLGEGGFDSSGSQISFLSGQIQKLETMYNVGDVKNISSAEYMNYTDEQKYAVDKIRDLILEMDKISKSDIKAEVNFGASESIKETLTPAIHTYNLNVRNDFSSAFISDTPREFYSSHLEPLIKETLERETLRYGKS